MKDLTDSSSLDYCQQLNDLFELYGRDVQILLDVADHQETVFLECKSCICMPREGEIPGEPEIGERQDDYSWNVIKAIMALANTRGGCVLVGIEDHDLKAIGIKAIKSRKVIQSDDVKEWDDYSRYVRELLEKSFRLSIRHSKYPEDPAKRIVYEISKNVVSNVTIAKGASGNLAILVLFVNESKEPIFVRERRNKESKDVFYVRSKDVARNSKLTVEVDHADYERPNLDWLRLRLQLYFTSVRRTSKTFVGREREIAELHELLLSGKIPLIHASGGTGKTELVCKYAETYRGERNYLGGQIFIEAGGLKSLPEVFSVLLNKVDVAQRYGLNEINVRDGKDNLDDLFFKIKHLLLHRSLREILLIIDNVDHTEMFLESELARYFSSEEDRRFHILATTRGDDFVAFNSDTVRPFPLEGLKEDEGLALFEQKRPFDEPAERNAALEITRYVQGNSWAIDMLSEQLKWRRRKYEDDYRTMLEELKSKPFDVLTTSNPHVRIMHGSLSPLELLRPSLEILPQEAMMVLQICLYFHPDFIHEVSVKKIYESYIGRECQRREWDSIFADGLHGHHLLTGEAENGRQSVFCRMHRLTKFGTGEFFKNMHHVDVEGIRQHCYNYILMLATSTQCTGTALAMLENLIMEGVQNGDTTILQIPFGTGYPLFNLNCLAAGDTNFCDSLLKAIRDNGMQDRLSEEMRLNIKATELDIKRLMFAVAEEDIEARQQICDALTSIFQADDFRCLYALLKLAETKRHRGDFKNSESITKKIVSAIENRDKNYPVFFSPMVYLESGKVLLELLQFAKANTCFQKSLQIYEKSGNELNRSVAHMWLSDSLSCLGDFKECIRHAEMSLELRRKVLPERHWLIAQSYSHLAKMYTKMGAFDNALKYRKKALDIRLETLPPGHKRIAYSYSNIGRGYYYLGDYDKALAYRQTAFEMLKKLLPPKDPDLGFSLNGIGDCYLNLGRYGEAYDCYKKAYFLFWNARKKNPMDMISAYYCLGRYYETIGNYKKALVYRKKALKCIENTTDEDSLFKAAYYDSVGGMQIRLGDYEQGCDKIRHAYDSREKAYKKDSSILAYSYFELGQYWYALGDYSKALSFFQQSADARKNNHLIEGSRLLCYTYNYEADTLAKLGRLDEALELAQKTNGYLKTRNAIPYEFALNMTTLSRVYYELGDYSKALSCSVEADVFFRQSGLPVTHPVLGEIYVSMGRAYSKQGSLENSNEYLRKALDIFKKSLSTGHPSCGEVLCYIADNELKAGNYAEASEDYRKARQCLLASLPESHPLILSLSKRMEIAP